MSSYQSLQTTQPTRLGYSLYVSDIMGTTTPKSHIPESIEYYRNNQPVLESIASTLGYGSVTAVQEAIEKGIPAKKGTPEFNAHLAIWDIGAMQGYKRKELQMPLEEGVKEIVEEIKVKGSRFVIYSSGGKDTSREGMKTNGLDGFVDAYYSSSQKEIGSKYDASAYRAIAQREGVSVSDICYITDDAKESEAAAKAGYGKVLFIKPDATAEDVSLAQQHGYVIIDNYMAMLAETSQSDNTQVEQSGAQTAE